MIFKSLRGGLAQVFSNKRMLFLFYAVNLFFGLILMLPFRAVLKDFAGHSLMGAELAGRLNMDFLFEFFRYNSEATSFFMGLAIIAAGLYGVTSLFLSGGALTVFKDGGTFTAQQFWGGGGQYFWRFFRLFLWSLPVLAILFSLRFIETGVQRLLFGSDPYEYVTYWGNWIRFGLSTLGLILFSMVFDYGRIHAVVTGEHRMRVSLWRALKFTFGNFGRTFGLALLLFLAGVAVLALYNPVANALAAPNAFVILLLFLVQQLYMLFRMVLKLTFFSSQMYLFENVSAEANPKPVVETGELGLQGA